MGGGNSESVGKRFCVAACHNASGAQPASSLSSSNFSPRRLRTRHNPQKIASCISLSLSSAC
ncbi:Uncharacterised protein [Shigella sonnei]|nr:Uncharacterised protein [Shigella sonnei]